jgi:NAD(P)-dependent dehydrogenase (short-subunit alcohol dehydrogenase family)
MRLRGRKALVTGAARRVGRAIALELARRGADVVVHFRTSADAAEETLGAARALGVTAVAVQADLAEPDGPGHLLDAAMRVFGRVDVLVNNAAIFRRTPLDTVSAADWSDHLAINLTAPFLLSVGCGRAMRRQGEGKIVHLADWAGERPYPGFLPYCVSKAGLVGLTRALALELAPQVQVNALALGPILNPEGFSRAEVAAIPQRNPLARMGTPEEVAAAAAFLIEGPDYITGAVLPVDGGRGIAP